MEKGIALHWQILLGMAAGLLLALPFHLGLLPTFKEPLAAFLHFAHTEKQISD